MTIRVVLVDDQASFTATLGRLLDDAALREQLLTNLLCYRANYAQIVVAWCLVCVVRHPLRVVWLLLLAAGWFHVLLVRRSVLNIPLGIHSCPNLRHGPRQRRSLRRVIQTLDKARRSTPNETSADQRQQHD